MRARLWLLLLVLFLFSFFLNPEPLMAAKVVKVTGKKVFLDLESDGFKKGDVLLVMGPKGKATGLIKIMQVKGTRALAKLGKGTAAPGNTLKPRSGKGSGSSQAAAKPEQTTSSSPTERKIHWGLMLGFAQNTMEVKLDGGDTVSMSGSGMSYKLLFDYPVFSQIWFRSMVGIENFSVSKDENICGEAPSTDKCEVNISYMTIDLWGRFMFNPESTYRFWAGAGFNLLFPSSKDASAIQNSSITNTSNIVGGGGLDLVLSGGKYIIPVQLEYGMYPSSSDVTASYFGARLGFGMSF